MFHLSNTTFQVGKLTMFNQMIKLINIMIKDHMKLKLLWVLVHVYELLSVIMCVN